MYRAIPKMSKIVESRMKEREESRHQDRIKRVKPTFKIHGNKKQADKSTTGQDLPAIPKSKKMYLEEERIREIIRQNNIIFEKMTNIANRKQTESRLVPPSSFGKRPGDTGTLNKGRRKRDLVKIALENELMMKRIQSQKSVYNVYKLEQDFVESQRYMANLCEMPLALQNAMGSTGMTNRALSQQPYYSKGSDLSDITTKTQDGFAKPPARKNNGNLRPLSNIDGNRKGMQTPIASPVKTTIKIGDKNLIVHLNLANNCLNIRLENPLQFEMYQGQVNSVDSKNCHHLELTLSFS
eukprot:TRINITY_DN6146_c0_g1_i5.p1 TRINITY_DN6146_c0_g1~~TRINITY_DN6146_c0_g1_i5.p1  ORF type:complete len:296 (+),score=43.81 TRINITY_DN6146_c0_g1_i5:190-1077(+)